MIFTMPLVNGEMVFPGFLLMALVSALIVVSWQCYKDCPWEGFSIIKFFRSFIMALLVATVLYELSQRNVIHETNWGIILLAITCLERAVGEIYKGFFEKKHLEYGKVFFHYHLGLKKQKEKFVIGLFVTFLMVALFYLYIRLPDYVFTFIPNRILLAAIMGLIGGFTVASGGAFKDTTFEPYNPVKFIRSPIAGMLGGIILSFFAQSNELLILSAIGFERVAVEWHKTFDKKYRRGIFDGLPIKFRFWYKVRSIWKLTYLVGVFLLALALVFPLVMRSVVR